MLFCKKFKVLNKLKFGTLITLILVMVTVLNIDLVVNATEISAKAYAVIEQSSGEIIKPQNEDKKLPMASTTKIMTALIVLEQKNLDKEFIVDQKAIMVEGSSMGLIVGDRVSLRDLAYGILIVSGNDAANAAAVKISGSIDKFAELMNKKAKELGLKNTNFKNPSGLPDDEHYTTAYDLAIITSVALKNKELKKICSTKQAKLEYGNPPYVRYLKNHNKLLWMYDGCIGVKTGFTKEAGRCLVSAATKNSQTLICVTLNASNDWETHTKLLDYGFATNKETIYIPKDNKIPIVVMDSNKDFFASTSKIIKIFVKESEHKNIIQEFFYRPFYYNNINNGDKVGYVNYVYNSKVIKTEDLIAYTDN